MAVKLTCELSSPAEVEAMLWGLARVCALQIRTLGLPALFASGVRYQREPKRREQWQTAVQTLKLKRGDCEDLVAYEVGWHWVHGDKRAHPIVYVPRSGIMHCQVMLGSGRKVDPSLVLGMRGA